MNFLWDPIINVRRSLQKLNFEGSSPMGYTKGLSWLQEKGGKDLIERITWNPTYQVMDAAVEEGESPKYWLKIFGIEEQFRL